MTPHTQKLMQKCNDSKNQKKNHPLLPDFSAISAIFPPKHDPPCKGPYNSRRHWNETSSASQAITAAHPISPMNCSSDNTQTLATSRQLSYETTSVSQPLTAVNPLNPIKSQFRQHATSRQLSYETTSASQPLTAVNPLNPIKSQFKHLVNAHQLSSNTQTRKPVTHRQDRRSTKNEMRASAPRAFMRSTTRPFCAEQLSTSYADRKAPEPAFLPKRYRAGWKTDELWRVLSQ